MGGLGIVMDIDEDDIGTQGSVPQGSQECSLENILGNCGSGIQELMDITTSPIYNDINNQIYDGTTLTPSGSLLIMNNELCNITDQCLSTLTECRSELINKNYNEIFNIDGIEYKSDAKNLMDLHNIICSRSETCSPMYIYLPCYNYLRSHSEGIQDPNQWSQDVLENYCDGYGTTECHNRISICKEDWNVNEFDYGYINSIERKTIGNCINRPN